MTRTSQSPRTDPFLEALFPVVGIAFVLLVFFLLYVAFARPESLAFQRGASASVPFAGGAAGAGPRCAAASSGAAGPTIFIRISSAGTIHIGGRSVDLSGVNAVLAARRFELPSSAVALLAEPGAPSSLVLRVADQCRLAGAGTIRLELAQEFQRT